MDQNLPSTFSVGVWLPYAEESLFAMVELLEPLALLVRHVPWVALAFVAALGSCLGSFMNVVVYRVPLEQSLLYPGSRCPHCQHPIRWHDNLPVVGWLWLRGRCRDCGSAISARYPLIEFVTLLLFATQWMQDVQFRAETDDLATAVMAFVWHVSLLSVLMCAALIDFDGHAIPRSLLIFGIATPVVLTSLSRSSVAHALRLDDVSRVWETLIVGSLLAALATLALKPSLPRRQYDATATTQTHPWTPLALSAITGLYLGPERALVTLVLATLFWRLLPLLKIGTGTGAPWSWYVAALSWLAVAFPS